jgi:hypothetical protein
LYDGRIPIPVDAPAEIYAAIDPQGLNHLAGNFSDNAARLGSSSVIVTAEADEHRVLLRCPAMRADIT